MTRFNLLGIHLTGTTLADASKTLIQWAREKTRRFVLVFAVDPLLHAHDDPALRDLANRADMVLTDGMPLVFVGRKFARLPITRCYGPDVMLRVFDEGRAVGIRHFLYGGTDEKTLSRLKENLLAKFPGALIAGARVPSFRPLTIDTPLEEEDHEAIREIEASSADIVWVGLGTPKQDFWISRVRPHLSTPVIIAVGAAFNFHAGTVRQAPAWMMRSGLEWLFRLLAEPRRLWRRYIVGNPRFIFLTLRQWLTRRPAPLGEHSKDTVP